MRVQEFVDQAQRAMDSAFLKLDYLESPENGTITMLCTGRYGVEEE